MMPSRSAGSASTRIGLDPASVRSSIDSPISGQSIRPTAPTTLRRSTTARSVANGRRIATSWRVSRAAWRAARMISLRSA